MTILEVKTAHNVIERLHYHCCVMFSSSYSFKEKIFSKSKQCVIIFGLLFSTSTEYILEC